MDSAVRGRAEIVSIDFIFGRLRLGHLVLQYTLLSLSPALPRSLPCTLAHHSVSHSLRARLTAFTSCLSLKHLILPTSLRPLVSALHFSWSLSPSHVHFLSFCLSSLAFYIHFISPNVFLIMPFCQAILFPPPDPFTLFSSNTFTPLFASSPVLYSIHPAPPRLPFSAASPFFMTFPLSPSCPLPSPSLHYISVSPQPLVFSPSLFWYLSLSSPITHPLPPTSFLYYVKTNGSSVKKKKKKKKLYGFEVTSDPVAPQSSTVRHILKLDLNPHIKRKPCRLPHFALHVIMTTLLMMDDLSWTSVSHQVAQGPLSF